MYSTVMTGAVHGIGSYLLRVETNISNGLPAFSMVGFISSDVETNYPVICSKGQKPQTTRFFGLFNMVGTYFGGRFLLYFSEKVLSRKGLLFCYLILWGKSQ